MIKRIMWLIHTIKVCIVAVKSQVYMSTRISDHPELGKEWTTNFNTSLAYLRERSLRQQGLNILNPIRYQIKDWNNNDYMIMWRIVIKIMAIRKATMVCYKEDWKASAGCKEEYAIAHKLGMNVIVKEVMPNDRERIQNT